MNKQEVVQAFTKLVQEKILRLQNTLRELTESAAAESKSTAGDKHETGLAMLQLEQEQKNKELTVLLNQLEVLQLTKFEGHVESVRKGSLVRTNQANFLICTSLGKVPVKDQTALALSPSSPLGEMLIGKKVGDACKFNNSEYRIMEIL